jgi:hypothetical protein
MKDWTPDEDQILRETYPSGGRLPSRLALAAAGHVRSRHEVIKRVGVLGLRFVGNSDRGSPLDPAVRERPLTPTSIEMIHWYAARGCSPGRTARDINRPVEVVERVLRETTPPDPAGPDWWPRREGAIKGRLPSYMTVIKQQRGLTA